MFYRWKIETDVLEPLKWGVAGRRWQNRGNQVANRIGIGVTD